MSGRNDLRILLLRHDFGDGIHIILVYDLALSFAKRDHAGFHTNGFQLGSVLNRRVHVSTADQAYEAFGPAYHLICRPSQLIPVDIPFVHSHFSGMYTKNLRP